MNLFTKQRQSHRCRNRLMAIKGEKNKLGDWN